MGATRTQLYLSAEQRQRIDQIAAVEGVTLAQVVRRALDRYLERELPDPAAALRETFGAAPDLVAPRRDDWERLIERRGKRG